MNSSTARSKKFREELKNNNERLDAYRKKDRERKKKQYHEKMSKLSVNEKKELQEKRRLHVAKRKLRKKKKKANTGNINKDCPRSLPKSPKKVTVVISKVVEDLSQRKRKAVLEACDKSVKRRKFESVERKKRSDAVTEEEICKVEEFFMRDDISRMCPGKKDFISVKTPGGRVQKQKRLLLLNVHEAFEVFMEDNDIKLGKAKLSSLRPAQLKSFQ